MWKMGKYCRKLLQVRKNVRQYEYQTFPIQVVFVLFILFTSVFSLPH